MYDVFRMEKKDYITAFLLFFPTAQLASCILIAIVEEHQLSRKDIHFVAYK